MFGPSEMGLHTASLTPVGDDQWNSTDVQKDYCADDESNVVRFLLESDCDGAANQSHYLSVSTRYLQRAYTHRRTQRQRHPGFAQSAFVSYGSCAQRFCSHRPPCHPGVVSPVADEQPYCQRDDGHVKGDLCNRERFVCVHHLVVELWEGRC